MLRAFINLISVSLVMAGLLFFCLEKEGLSEFAQPGLRIFLPWLTLIFLFNLWLSEKLFKWTEQPPLMIFLLSMVIKMMMSLCLLLVYLLQHLGPQNQGAAIFIMIYLIFEILEIKRFLSILRPDSIERKPE